MQRGGNRPSQRFSAAVNLVLNAAGEAAAVGTQCCPKGHPPSPCPRKLQPSAAHDNGEPFSGRIKCFWRCFFSLIVAFALCAGQRLHVRNSCGVTGTIDILLLLRTFWRPSACGTCDVLGHPSSSCQDLRLPALPGLGRAAVGGFNALSQC